MGQIISTPLFIPAIIEHAVRNSGSTGVVSRRIEGDIHRTTYQQVRDRSKQLANALATLGAQPGERVGTLTWNGYRHLEIYYGVSGSGSVCRTINPRLFPDQIAYIVGHAGDQYVFSNLTFVPLVEGIAPHCPNVKGWVAMTDRVHIPTSSMSMLCYEELLGAQSADYTWPQFDGNTTSSLYHTSDTTGNPKGTLYSHRSTVLHSYASAMSDALGCSAQDVILPVVPMFHVSAWGLPYSVPLVGAKLVLPGPKLDGTSLFELFEQEKVTFSAGMPTVWLGLLQHMQANKLEFSMFCRTVIGGSAAPPAMIRTLSELDAEVIHAWGVTEMSPLGITCKLMGKHADLPDEAKQHVLERQGRAIYGVEMKIVDAEGHELPWDGKAFGDFYVRGPRAIQSYYRNEVSSLVDDWFPTGDVADIDADGYMQITDRNKDVIRSGGEWISSIDVENVAVTHPGVHMTAYISCYHPKWDERPLLVVMKKPGVGLTCEEMFKFFEGKAAKWWIPDDVVFVTETPPTAIGKVQKLKLREQFKDYQFPVIQA